ncbi:MAG: LytTR family DNA-binding domain-containing protein [Planctomycetota bacterium]
MDNLPLLSVLVVDDEPLARKGLIDLLSAEPGFAVSGECGDGRSAVDAIRSLRPDLVCLDIQMPEMNGFEVMLEVGDEMPSTIIVTAFDQYAIQAFEHHAIDYLLKPVDPDRFQKAMARAARRFSDRRGDPGLSHIMNLLRELDGKSVFRERLVVKTYSGVLYLGQEEVMWIEASDNYIRFHLNSKKYLVRETMKQIEERLDPRRFVRIHRSYIVNMDQVREVRPAAGGSDNCVILRDDTQLPVGRTYRDRVFDLLRKN